MLAFTEAKVAAIRTAVDQGGELSVVAEFRCLFPGLANSADVRLWAPTIAARAGKDAHEGVREGLVSVGIAAHQPNMPCWQSAHSAADER